MSLLVLASCGGIPNDDAYAESLAEVACDVLQRCALGYFDSEFSSEEDCRGEVEDQIADTNEAYNDADCDFQPDEASRCIGRVRGMACRDYEADGIGRACDLVYRCENGNYYGGYY